MRFIIIVVTIAVWSGVIKADENATTVRPGLGQPKFDDIDWELSKAMGITKKYENVVISPISLRVVLGLLLDAANGTTADEIVKFLKIDAEHLTDKDKIRKHFHELITSLNKPSDSSLTSDVVTRIFADQRATLNETFLKIVKENYVTEVEKVDFAQLSDVIKKINKWAEGATHGHISDLLSEGDADATAVMLLLNVIFFNGLWSNPFDEKETQTESFYLNDRQYIRASMMKAQHELQYAQTYDGELQLLRMPYQGGTFAMYFVLPRNRNGLDDLIKNVTPGKIHSLMKTMTAYNVNITLPKFKFSYNIGLKPALEKFGIKTMFGATADFSNMENNSSSLFVSNILQKAGIEVNEKGSTAYASTVAEVQNKFGGVSTVEFRADRPFLFFIEEDTTRNVVFVGKVTNPGVFAKASNEQDKLKTTTKEVSIASLLPSAPQQPATGQTLNEQEDEQGLLPLEATQLSYFDIDLLEAIGYSNKLENIVLSPVSIKTVLGLILYGAAGSTASELQMTLHLSENKTEAENQLLNVQKEITLMSTQMFVKSANALFFANAFQPKKEFEEYAVGKYFTMVDRIDPQDPLSTINKINDWINKETEGLIPTAVTPGIIKQDTKLISVNAIHFKAKWLYTFPKQATRPQLFYTTKSKTTCVQMMSIKAIFKYSYEKDINADVLQIPFKNTAYTFAIILPRNKHGIQRLQSDLQRKSIIDLLNDPDSLEVTLSIPRFKAEFQTELTEKLKHLRTTEIFENSAQLPNIIQGQKNLKVDAIVHKVFIEVNEEGAEAGAATVAAVVPLMSPGEKIDIVIDHPFLFFIYHSESKIILFEGRINQPEETTNTQCQAAQNKKPIKTVLDEIYNFDIRQQNTYGSPTTYNNNNNGNQESININNSQNNNERPPKVEDRFTFTSNRHQPTIADQKTSNVQQNVNPVNSQFQPAPKPGQAQNVNYDKNRQTSQPDINMNPHAPEISAPSSVTNTNQRLQPNSQSINNKNHDPLIFPNN